jgi:8-oxo-dGTP pyrophosphatase MutT (NUDIX family)
VVAAQGHVEPGETEADTAVREVAEETGILGR